MLVWVAVAAVVLFLPPACASPPPLPPPEPAPATEEPVSLDCKPEKGWTVARTERECGKPTRKTYVNDLKDGVVWRYCRTAVCLQFYGVAFWNDSLLAHGAGYDHLVEP